MPKGLLEGDRNDAYQHVNRAPPALYKMMSNWLSSDIFWNFVSA